jgi:hypothetical protein
MPQFDKSAIKAGLFMTGADHRAHVVGIDAPGRSALARGSYLTGGPPRYGMKLASPDPEIQRRIDAARKQLDALLAQIGKRK